MGIVSDAAKFIENCDVKLESTSTNTMIVIVKDKVVILQKKPGRTEVSCSCNNHSRFCNTPVMCKHKLAASTYLVMRKIEHEKIVGGYRKIRSPSHKYSQPDRNGYILEHRMVIENHIKRGLKRPEVVHHIDENKLNNDINNLMIFPNAKEHAAFHVKIRQFGMTNPIIKQIAERWEKEPVYAFDENDMLVEVNDDNNNK